MNEAIHHWMTLATAGEQAELASIADTSRGHLYQLSTGERRAGPELAGRIATASRALRSRNKKLPLLRRSELCPACGECEFAKRCKG
jgi:hypothetical protein